MYAPVGHTATEQAGSGGLTATEHRLGNGLRLVLSEDHLNPVAAVCLWYDVGSRYEVKGRTGLAHLFEHLMFQGSAQVKGNGHFELVQAGGGSLNGTTSFERTNYFETMPAHQLELALWLEADRMGSLLAALDEESLQNQRDVVKNERRQRYDNVPYGTAFERMTALAYPEGHPYHHIPIGSMADLDAVTLEDARAFFRANYAPNNAVLAVVGDIDPEQTRRWAERYFGSIPPYDGKVPPRDGALPDIIGAELRVEIREEVPLRALMAGYRMPRDGTRECDAAELALTVLGDGMASRLYNRLVRRDRTAVTADFGLVRLAGAPSLGWLDVKASGGAEIPQIEAAVDEELARLRAEAPGAEEMERAQALVERGWLDRLNTVAGRADELCRYALLFGDPQLAFTAVSRILDVTAEEVRAVAAARLRPDNRAVLVYEPVTSENGRPGRRPGRCSRRERQTGRSRPVTDAAVTMDFHPQPAAGQPKPWAFPVPERGALGNGLAVLGCHRPGQQVAAVQICLDMPLDAEPDRLEGIAAIMMSALAEGTSKHTAEEFAAELERCGATLDTSTDYQGARVSLEVPVSRLPQALGLLTEALQTPTFPSSEIERLVRNRLDEIPLEMANPGRRAARQLAQELFPASARLSRPRKGTEDTVARINAADARAFYQAHVRPGRATAVVVGDLTGVDLDAVLAGTLGGWTGDAAEPAPMPPVAADAAGRVVIVDRPGAVQTQLLIGRTGPDRHDRVWPALVLGTYCLGGTLTSRLDRVLREEKGYTYGVRAFQRVLRSPAPPAAGGAAGVSVVAISGSVDTASTGPALDDVWKVLRTLAAEGLTETERDTAVQNLVGVAPLRYETAASVAGTLADQVEQHLPDGYQAQLYARLAETSTAEATAAVIAAFPVNRLLTILVGDTSQIKAPVRALGIGDVEVVTG